MCGLVFTIHRDPMATRLDDFFGDAFLASAVRGVDAAGLFQVDKQGQLFTRKKSISVGEFVKDTQIQRIISDVNKCPLTVGHVRHATVGDKSNDANAHPFTFERNDRSRVVGVHNGTLKGWKDKAGGDQEDVDSAWAINKIADEGLDAFQYFNGAFAFIWWDSRDPDFVWIARNEERTLYYYVSQDGKSMMGCSELGMLGWLTSKHGFGKHRNGDSGLYYFEPGKAYKVSIKDMGKLKTFDLPKYNPETTLAKETTATQTPVHYFPRQGESSNEEVAKCDVPFVMGPTGAIANRISNTTGSSATTHGTTRTTTTRTPHPPEIVKAKIALRRARDRRLGRSPNTNEPIDAQYEVVDSDALDERQNNAIRDALNNAASNKRIDAWEFVKKNWSVQKPNDRLATRNEISRAIFDKVYGRLVPLMGVDYDDEQMEVLGEAYVHEGGKQITIDCCLRNIPSKVANDVYIKGSEPVLVCVVGMLEQKGLEPPMYVVANLSMENRLEIQRRLLREDVDRVLPETQGTYNGIEV